MTYYGNKIEDEIRVEVEGQTVVYKRHRILTTEDKIDECFTKSFRHYLFEHLKISSGMSIGEYRVVFTMKQDCDVVQSAETKALKDIGFYISNLHPYPKGLALEYHLTLSPLKP